VSPDAIDKPTTEFYYMKAFPYADRYLGLLMKYYADPDKPGQHSAILSNELMVSDDARTWKRPFRDINIGFWCCVDPVSIDGHLVFFAYDEKNGMALQLYRPQGMTAVRAEQSGEFVTAPFTMPSEGISLNADAHAGVVELALLDADKKPLAGVDAVRLSEVDSPSIPVLWPNGALEKVKDLPCRLRIRISNGSVYAINAALSAK